MKKFYTSVVLMMAVLFSIIGSVNYIKDPAFVLHHGKLEKKVALAILNDQYVAIPSNMNDRLLQQFLITENESIPDGIILGSSRVMGISCDSLGFKTGLNHSMAAARFKDIMGILGLYLENKRELPKNIVIGIDARLFSKNNNNINTFFNLENEYNYWLEQSGITVEAPQKHFVQQQNTAQLFSITYYQSAIKTPYKAADFINADLTTSSTFYDELGMTNFVRCPDGSRVYPKSVQNKSLDEVMIEIKDEVMIEIKYEMANQGFTNDFFSTISPEIKESFEESIDYLQNKDISITFIFAPIHPLLWDNMISLNDEYNFEVEQYVRQFASEKNIPVIGSYNPHTIGATEKDFYDVYHSKREFINQLCMNQSS